MTLTLCSAWSLERKKVNPISSWQTKLDKQSARTTTFEQPTTTPLSTTTDQHKEINKAGSRDANSKEVEVVEEEVEVVEAVERITTDYPLSINEQEFQGGRLRFYWKKWQQYGVSEKIINTVRYGIRLPTTNIDYKYMGENMKTNKEQTEWMRVHISNTLMKKFIRRLPRSERNKVYISPWHLVPKPRTLYRHIINMKTVNPNFDAISFKMESTSTLSRMLEKGMWATKWDLVSGYNHAYMHPDTWKLLTFEFKEDLYQYITLPFGLNTAPREFSKIVGAAVKILCKEGILLFFYLDDFPVLGRTQEQCKTATARFLTVMQELGFIFAPSKSVMEPTQNVEHLGVGYNLQEGFSYATEKKVQAINDMINQVLKIKRARIPFISKLVGKLNFTACTIPWIRPLIHRLQSRMMKKVAKNRNHYMGNMAIQQSIKQDLSNIQYILAQHNQLPFEMNTTMTPVCSDSTTEAYGGVYQNKVVMGRWPSVKEEQSINMLELMAFEKTLDLIIQSKPSTEHVHLHVFTDNTTAKSYIQKGYGRIKPLRDVAKRIWLKCRQENVWIRKVSWIPTLHNKEADNISRISQEQFQELVESQSKQAWDLSSKGPKVCGRVIEWFMCTRT